MAWGSRASGHARSLGEAARAEGLQNVLRRQGLRTGVKVRASAPQSASWDRGTSKTWGLPLRILLYPGGSESLLCTKS